MNRFGGVIGGSLLVLVTACSSMPGPTTTPEPTSVPGPDAASAFPGLKSFGPDFPPAPPPGELVRIDGAVLSRDRRTLYVGFIGGKIFDPMNPCSIDYGAWAGVANETLNVQVHVIVHPEQVKLRPNLLCTAEGHGYMFRIRLADPVRGLNVVDRASGPLWIAPPDAIAELPIADEWSLFRIYADEMSHVVGRSFEAPPDGAASVGRSLSLYQTFGRPPEMTIDAPVAKRMIRGQEVQVGRNGDAGYIVSWMLGNDGMRLVSSDATMTLDAFVAAANAVAVPGR